MYLSCVVNNVDHVRRILGNAVIVIMAYARATILVADPSYADGDITFLLTWECCCHCNGQRRLASCFCLVGKKFVFIVIHLIEQYY